MARDEKGRFLPGNTIGKDTRITGRNAGEMGKRGNERYKEVAKDRRTMRQFAKIYADMATSFPMPDGSKMDTTYAGAVVFRQFQKAITKGDTKSAEFLAKLLGELQQDINLNIEKLPEGLTKDQAREFIAQLNK